MSHSPLAASFEKSPNQSNQKRSTRLSYLMTLGILAVFSPLIPFGLMMDLYMFWLVGKFLDFVPTLV